MNNNMINSVPLTHHLTATVPDLNLNNMMDGFVRARLNSYLANPSFLPYVDPMLEPRSISHQYDNLMSSLNPLIVRPSNGVHGLEHHLQEPIFPPAINLEVLQRCYEKTVATHEKMLKIVESNRQRKRKKTSDQPMLGSEDTHISCMKTSPNAPLDNWYDMKRKCHRIDVLFGKGGNSFHQGNILYRNRIMQLRPLYRAEISKELKTTMAWNIVEEIYSCGARFLIKDATTNLWKELSNEDARKKVSQALREKRSTQEEDEAAR